MKHAGPLDHPSHIDAERLCLLAESQEGDAARVSYLRAALVETQAARSVSAELPRWRERLWISAVEKARRAQCPAIAARIAGCYLTEIDLPAKRQREWLETVLHEGDRPIEAVGGLTVSEIERMLLRAGVTARPAERRAA
jgi:hypothetical protein